MHHITFCFIDFIDYSHVSWSTESYNFPLSNRVNPFHFPSLRTIEIDTVSKFSLLMCRYHLISISCHQHLSLKKVMIIGSTWCGLVCTNKCRMVSFRDLSQKCQWNSAKVQIGVFTLILSSNVLVWCNMSCLHTHLLLDTSMLGLKHSPCPQPTSGYY